MQFEEGDTNEPKELAAKVKRLVEGKNLFVVL
jgi:hypothetical protein